VKDPRYRVYDDGTSMRLSIGDEYYSDPNTPEEEKVSVQTLSYAYEPGSHRRAVFVFLYYLHHLSARHQKHWESHQISGDFRMDKDYMDRTLRGEFTDNCSIYEALLEEERQVNVLCAPIGKPPLFKKEYERNELPNFNHLLRPTLRSYDDFTMILEKLVPGNINTTFFKDDISFTDERGEDISQQTIKLLEKWFNTFYHPRDPNALAAVFRALRGIRTERQAPAHKINPDEYNEEYFKKQKDLMVSAYRAVQALRLMLSNHPAVRSAGYHPPDWLEQGKIKL